MLFFFLFTDFFDSPQQSEHTEQTPDPGYLSFLLCYVSQHGYSNIIIYKLWKPYWNFDETVTCILSCQNCDRQETFTSILASFFWDAVKRFEKLM